MYLLFFFAPQSIIYMFLRIFSESKLSVKVQDIVVKDVITISSGKTINSVKTHMDYFNVDTVIVTQDNEPIGLITRNDIKNRITEKGLNPHLILVEEVCSEPLKWVSYNTTLTEVAEIMNNENIRRLPIFGNLTGGPVLLGMYIAVPKKIVQEIAA